MKIIPVQPRPTATAVETGTRVTFGYRIRSRRTFGGRFPSRRSFNFKVHPSRRTFGHKFP